ncbi:MAG: DUF1501 domain-containing protein [Solirubrobacteraceae bacterium]|nr:DUF1501 domain-containing protein [Solirubrobacteraceae bacterium]
MSHQHCHDYARSHAMAGAGLPQIEPGMPVPAGTGLTRRSMLLRTLGLGVAVYGGGALAGAQRLEAAINDALGQHRVVVSVFVDGGWDNLSLLAPFGLEADLARLRPNLTTSIDRAKAVPLDLDPRLSWHPAAAGLRALYDDPAMGVAIAPAIGYDDANYSHFTSRHFWETGTTEVNGRTGWMGRYLDRVGSPDVPIQGITVGGSLSPSLATGKVPVSAIWKVDGYDYWIPGAWGPNADAGNGALRHLAAKKSGDRWLDQARLTTGAAFGLLDSVRATKPVPASGAAYPTIQSQFVTGLRDTARLLSTRVNGSALPIRCVGLRAHGGYDTHSAQEPSFSENLKITADGIRAFWQDLAARGEDDRVVMVVWSEFGRRPAENGSAGCDHGAAGTAFVIGRQIKQGLIGEFPGLQAAGSTGSGLMQDGNLRATSDFRGLYAALLEQWLGTGADGIIPDAAKFARPGLI